MGSQKICTEKEGRRVKRRKNRTFGDSSSDKALRNKIRRASARERKTIYIKHIGDRNTLVHQETQPPTYSKMKDRYGQRVRQGEKAHAIADYLNNV